MYGVVFITAPSEDVAAQIGRTLVEERLAACVNIVPAVRSLYRWEGQVQDDREALLVVKTLQERFPALEARVREIHPYTVPEVVMLPIQAGSEPYLAWLTDSTS